jgi:hypothetical protein
MMASCGPSSEDRGVVNLTQESSHVVMIDDDAEADVGRAMEGKWNLQVTPLFILET